VPAAEAVRTGTSGTAALIARQRDLRDVTLQKRKTGVARGPAQPVGRDGACSVTTLIKVTTCLRSLDVAREAVAGG